MLIKTLANNWRISRQPRRGIKHKPNVYINITNANLKQSPSTKGVCQGVCKPCNLSRRTEYGHWAERAGSERLIPIHGKWENDKNDNTDDLNRHGGCRAQGQGQGGDINQRIKLLQSSDTSYHSSFCGNGNKGGRGGRGVVVHIRRLKNHMLFHSLPEISLGWVLYCGDPCW